MLQKSLWRAGFLLSGLLPIVFMQKGVCLPPLIYHLKYYHGKEIGLLLGRMFGKDLVESDFLKPVDMIVPVPLHPKKEKKTWLQPGLSHFERIIGSNFSSCIVWEPGQDNI